jgi:hypothetical protein
MPAEYHIDLTQRRVYSKANGVLSRADLSGHMNRLTRDPQFHPSFSQLLDFREVTEIAFSSEDVVELAEIRIFSPESKRAMVAPGALKYGLARMYESHRESKGDLFIRVFTGYQEAVDWLDFENSPDARDGAGPAMERKA